MYWTNCTKWTYGFVRLKAADSVFISKTNIRREEMKKLVVIIAVVISMTACTGQVKKRIVEATRIKTMQLGYSEGATKQMYSGIIEAGKKALQTALTSLDHSS